MAISSGAAPHSAFLNCSAGVFPIEHGTVTQQAKRKSSSFSVTIPRNYPGAMGLAALDSADASVTASGVGGSGSLIDGPIDTVDVDFIGGYIRVTGRDRSSKLHDMKVSQKWQNIPGSEIVSQLAGQAGLGFSGNSIGMSAGRKLIQDYVKMADNIPMGQLMNKLAEFDGAKWWVKNGVLNYATLGTTTGGGYSITCTTSGDNQVVSDALRLQVKKNLVVANGFNINVKSWHPRDKKAVTGQSTVGNGAETKTFNVPGLDQSYADQFAKGKAKEIGRHKITVTATVVGDPSIDIGGSLNLSGTGVLDGSYEMEQIVHEFGMSGYTMNITAKSMDGGGQ